MTTLARPPRRKPMFSSTPRAVLTAGMIAVLVATGGGAVATAQPSTTPATPTSSTPTALQQQAPVAADPCATTTAPTTTTTTAAPSTTTPATPTSCAEVPTPATSQAPTTASEAPSVADVPATGPVGTTAPTTSSLTPSAEATAPTPTGERIPYTGLPTENPNSTLIPGKMRSDREEWPEPFTKEEADQAEIGEARLLAKQRTSRAAVTCQRYWPSNFDVCGAIRDKYNSLGGSFSFLLLPTSGNIVNPGGTGERVTFMNGPIYWSAGGGAHPVVNSFLNRWGILGYEGSYLKYPTTDEIVLPDGGRRQEFQDGAIYVAFQNAIGSAIQNGPIREKYNSVGGLTPGSSSLGYLTGDHIRVLPDGQGQMARFQNGVIYHHPTHGTRIVRGLILIEWTESGYEGGTYGYPTNDEYTTTGGVAQDFQGGAITAGLPATDVSKPLYDCTLNVEWPEVTESTNYVRSNVEASCTDPKQKIEAEIRHFWTRAGTSQEVKKGTELPSVTTPAGNVRNFNKNLYMVCFNGTYRVAVEFRITNADGGVIKQRHTTNPVSHSNCQTGLNECPGISSQDCNGAYAAFLYAQWFNSATRPNYSGNKEFRDDLGHLPAPNGKWIEYDVYQAGPNGRLAERVVVDSGARIYDPFYFSKDHFTTQGGYTLITPEE